jgi:hypothetical protein
MMIEPIVLFQIAVILLALVELLVQEPWAVGRVPA